MLSRRPQPRLALTCATRGGSQPSRHPALFLARGIRRCGLVTRQLGWWEHSGAKCRRQAVGACADGAIPIRRPRQPSPSARRRSVMVDRAGRRVVRRQQQEYRLGHYNRCDNRLAPVLAARPGSAIPRQWQTAGSSKSPLRPLGRRGRGPRRRRGRVRWVAAGALESPTSPRPSPPLRSGKGAHRACDQMYSNHGSSA
jgi:hypothetical protein